MEWIKSRYCDTNGCVEVGEGKTEILVRNSQDPGGSVLRFPKDQWAGVLDDFLAEDFPSFSGARHTAPTP